MNKLMATKTIAYKWNSMMRILLSSIRWGKPTASLLLLLCALVVHASEGPFRVAFDRDVFVQVGPGKNSVTYEIMQKAHSSRDNHVLCDSGVLVLAEAGDYATRKPRYKAVITGPRDQCAQLINQVNFGSMSMRGLIRGYRFVHFDFGSAGTSGYLLQYDTGDGFTTGTGAIQSNEILSTRDFSSLSGLPVTLNLPVQSLFVDSGLTSDSLSQDVPEQFRAVGFTHGKVTQTDRDGSRLGFVVRFDPGSGSDGAASRCWYLHAHNSIIVLSLFEATYEQVGPGDWRFKSVAYTENQTKPMSPGVSENFLVTTRLVFRDWETNIADIDNLQQPIELVGARVEDRRGSTRFEDEGKLTTLALADVRSLSKGRGALPSGQSRKLPWVWLLSGLVVALAGGFVIWRRGGGKS